MSNCGENPQIIASMEQLRLKSSDKDTGKLKLRDFDGFSIDFHKSPGIVRPRKVNILARTSKKDEKVPSVSHSETVTSPKTSFNQEKIIQCATCNTNFSEAKFESHVCPNDEDGKPIPDLSSPSMFDEYGDNVLELLKFNGAMMSQILKEQFKINIEDKNKQSGPFSCDRCDRKFIYFAGLQRHEQKHRTEIDPSKLKTVQMLQELVKCMECGQIFSTIGIASGHFKEKHNEQREKYTEDEPLSIDLAKVECVDEIPSHLVRSNMKYLKVIAASSILQCEFCDVLFTKQGDLFHHMSEHDSRSGFQCTMCEISVTTLKEINLHWQTDCVFVRFEQYRHINLMRCYVCNVCEEHFTRLEDLYMHRHITLHFFPRHNSATKEMEIVCEKCEFFSVHIKELVEHHNTDHTKKSLPQKKQNVSSKKPRPHLCDICGKSYTQSSHLWQHLRFHQGVKPFECPKEGCDRKFTIRPDLNDHIRKCHTGERPYHCLMCGKRFLTGSVFYQHRLIHRGERRYGCEDCGKRFYRADALKNHQRIHSGKHYPLFLNKSLPKNPFPVLLYNRGKTLSLPTLYQVFPPTRGS